MACRPQRFDVGIVTIGLVGSEIGNTVQSTRWLKSLCGLKIKNVVVVRDQSTRDEVLRDMNDEMDILIQEENGISGAFNTAHKAIHDCRYVLYLNAGDRLIDRPDTSLVKLLAKELQEEQWEIMTFQSRLGKIVMPRRYVQALARMKGPRFITSRIPHQSTFIKTSIIVMCRYDNRLRIRMDYDLFYNQLRANRKRVLFEELLVEMAEGGVSSHRREGYKEECRIHKETDWSNLHRFRLVVTELLNCTILKK